MTPSDKLAQAAQAVIERWDSPLWRQEVGTNDLINAMRAELAAFRAAPGHRDRYDMITEMAYSLKLASRGDVVPIEILEVVGRQFDAAASVIDSSRKSAVRWLVGIPGTPLSEHATWLNEPTEQALRDLDVAASTVTPLYAAPQAEPSEPVQAQPEPLSDEQIAYFCGEIYLSDHTGARGTQSYDLAVARAIEAAHGIGAKTGGA